MVCRQRQRARQSSGSPDRALLDFSPGETHDPAPDYDPSDCGEEGLHAIAASTAMRKPLSCLALVGAPGLEPGTFCSQSRRATKLRHAPIFKGSQRALRFLFCLPSLIVP